MRIIIFFILLLPCCLLLTAAKTIHIFVALCDNANQGIVPVPARLGNGQDAPRNLYWGATFGVKAFFINHKDWLFQRSQKKPNQNVNVLERAIFRFKQSDAYFVADAYEGAAIRQAIIAFLSAASGLNTEKITLNGREMEFGGGADLVAYAGHNGLMDFQLPMSFSNQNKKRKDAIILACLSKTYFSSLIQQSGAYPLLWTTGLMSPEAYTLEAALSSWSKGQTGEHIRLAAANAYHAYQKCGLDAAKKLLVSGW